MKKLFFVGLYQSITLLLLPFFLLFILGTLLRKPIYRKNMAQRFGLYPATFFKLLQGKKVVWIHAASVGEVMMSRFFVRSFKARHPDSAIVFSTITPTGQAAAREYLSDFVVSFIYFPFDYFWIARGVVRRISPTLFIFMETEIWPNCLRSLSKRKIPSIMANGRISTRSFPGYQKLRPFISLVLNDVSLFLMQSAQDAERLIRLGAPLNRVEETGNMKYDQAGSAEDQVSGACASFAAMGLSEDQLLMIAGSTRPGEEDAVLKAYRILHSKMPGLRLMIAPRHLGRLDAVEGLVSAAGFQSIRKGQISGPSLKEDVDTPKVILMDTLGELASFYALAHFIFVGGSLAPFGGHNPLEPAACKKPVFFGGHMENFQEIAEQLTRSGGGIQVADGNELAERILWLSKHPEEYEQRAQAAYDVVFNHRGAVQRNLDRIALLMEKI